MARAKKKTASSTPRVSDKARDAKIKQYRSQLLEKIRDDIATKRAAISAVQKVTTPDLGSMGYWKMAYWKMKYWKMGGSMLNIDEIINPATGAVAIGRLQAKRKKTRK